MAEFLTTKSTVSHIEKIIIEAEKKLVLVSPYLQISKTFFERLKDASNKNIKITIIFGKNELKPNEENLLDELKNLELLFYKNLHAKCYFNEKAMVITSMNLYEFSENNNREMGVFITKQNDKNIFEQAVNETHSIMQSHETIKLAKTKRKLFENRNKSNKKAKKKQTKGYCIRCEERIQYNTEKPYCYNCFAIWSQFENPDFEENVCHSCGESEVTSMNRPECYDCFVKNKKNMLQDK